MFGEKKNGKKKEKKVMWILILGVLFGTFGSTALIASLAFPQEINRNMAAESVRFCQQQGYDGVTWETWDNDLSFDCARIEKKHFTIGYQSQKYCDCGLNQLQKCEC